MSVELLIEHHLEFLSLKGGFTVSSDSTFVKIPHVSHCWKYHVMSHLISKSGCNNLHALKSISSILRRPLWLVEVYSDVVFFYINPLFFNGDLHFMTFEK